MSNFTKQRLSSMPNTLAHDWAGRQCSPLDGTSTSTKSLVERLCDLKIYALSVSGYIGSISATDKATLKAEAHALQCTTTGPYNAILTNLLCVGSVCVDPSSVWEKKFLASSSARSTADAFTVVGCFDRNGKLDDSLQDKKQKSATALFRDKSYEHDFAGRISPRAFRFLRPISRFRIVETLLYMKLVAWRPSWTHFFCLAFSAMFCARQ